MASTHPGRVGPASRAAAPPAGRGRALARRLLRPAWPPALALVMVLGGWELWVRFPSVIMIASDSAIAHRAPVLRRTLAALSQGYTYAARHPHETARILEAADGGLRGNPGLVLASARFLAPAYADGGRWGTQTLARIKGLGDLLWRAGALKDRDGGRVPRPDFSAYFTNALLPPAARRPPPAR